MSELKPKTLNINVIGAGEIAMNSDIPITVYIDGAGKVSKATIHFDEIVELAIYIATHSVEIIAEQVKRQGEQIRDLQNLLAE
jgi:hypothetical protein